MLLNRMAKLSVGNGLKPGVEIGTGKALRPPAGLRRASPLMTTSWHGAAVAGVTSCSFHSLNGLVAREAGTVIATPDIMASMVYYK